MQIERTPHIAPLNSTKELTYSDYARMEFCNGTGFDSPEDVVNAGLKTEMDWCHLLGNFREKYGGQYNQAKRNDIEISLAEKKQILVDTYSVLRQKLLRVLRDALIEKPTGLPLSEVRIKAHCYTGVIDSMLNDLIEEGLVVETSQIKKGQVRKVYRLAGDYA